MKDSSEPSTYSRYTEDVSSSLIPGIGLKRLELFLSGPYPNHNLCAALDRGRLNSTSNVRLTRWTAANGVQTPFEEGYNALAAGEGTPLGIGDKVGISWTHHWVKVEIDIPPEWKDCGEPVVFEFDPGCEGLIFNKQGHVLHGITGGENSRISAYPGYYEDRRVEHVLPRSAVELGHYECWIEVSCNGLYGIGINGQRHHEPDMNMLYYLTLADLVLYRGSAHALRHDFQLLHQLARAEDGQHSSLSRRALKTANEVMNTFRVFKDQDAQEGIIQKCREIAGSIVHGRQHLPKSEDSKPTKIWATGHCHIDTAWLWQFSHTRQKIARSWSTQLDLFDRFPSHQFSASSAQQYAWLEESYPELFERVRSAVRAKRFIPVGGSWVEYDCILPSGETLVRQQLYGQRYFQAKFGVRSREAWLPDTFGYASQLPQILRLSGIEYFFTQKLSWNNINVFPHSTFNWAGIDGSKVLAHMTPTNTYNGQANYSELVDGVRRNKNLEVTDECLLLFGNGDGGGGPTPYMLEKLERLEATSRSEPEIPTVKVVPVIDFFDHLKRKTLNGKRLPTWRGELYFELHRGTFTSQAAIKKGNRTMEKLLRDVEYFATLASLSLDAYKYPKQQLDEIWKDILLCGFHDVLPGTSIKAVVDDAVAIYARRETEIRALLREAISAHLGGVTQREEFIKNGDSAKHPTGQTLLVLDATRSNRQQIVKVPSKYSASLPISQGYDEEQVLAFLSSSGDSGQLAPLPQSASSPRALHQGNDYILSNSDFRLTISSGRIISLFDVKLNRELIVAGPGATSAGLVLYEDFPLSYDAWDIEVYHLEMGRDVAFDKVEVINGPLRSTLRCTASSGQMTAVFEFSLDAVLPGRPAQKRSWITIDAKVDWHETHKTLKFVLPIDIHSPYATYGTQYGLIDRPTHRNTTIDAAKFEVCAHMLGDLSEASYGVTLVSDYKYGYAVEGNVIRLSLLRSATAPDPTQDMGKHEFSLAIMPHEGRLIESGTYRDAIAFTNEVHFCAISHALQPPRFTISIEGTAPAAQSIILDAVKRGEDDFANGSETQTSVIFRMYESLGGRATGQLRLRGPVTPKSLTWVNLLEEPLEDEQVQFKIDQLGCLVELRLRTFEIKTLRILL
ncbi:glycosyl hydrolases family 38 N-terminal domain-domain-containing protein [Naematelia encephala]|uniref:alpha-mannosidase n=1 Tax=Naematelia encephala TaxID=71784 RepID=A0A1Y2AE68_9TREE|nr:glycosyl hydrolases family 38 N-terminal domain-domain-containing protein [Naematelia encephala]